VRCLDNGCNVTTAQPVVLVTSDDGGKTWGPLIEATHEQPAPAHAEVGVQPVVLPNGHVVIVYADVQAGAFTFEGSYKAIRSTDGGKTWSDPVVISPANPFLEEGSGLRAPNVPAAAVDVDGTISVAFQDQRLSPGKNDILLTTSTDEGQHWSPPVDATPLEPTLDHFTAAIAVVGGKVHLTYRTHLAGTNVSAPPPASLVDAVYRALQGGVTTSGPFVLKTSDAAVAAFATVAGVPLKFFGDYAGIAASSIAAHPIWDQSETFADAQPNPTNTHQRSFSARIQ
jgi:Neuraminidase (sialidase)